MIALISALMPRRDQGPPNGFRFPDFSGHAIGFLPSVAYLLTNACAPRFKRPLLHYDDTEEQPVCHQQNVPPISG